MGRTDLPQPTTGTMGGKQSRSPFHRALCPTVLWLGHSIVYVRCALGLCHQSQRRTCSDWLCAVGDPGTLGVFHDRRWSDDGGHEPHFRLSGSSRIGFCIFSLGPDPALVDVIALLADVDRHRLSRRGGFSMTDPKTLSVYAEKAEDYAAMSAKVDKKDPSLRAFIAAMPKGGRVLDLGCGPGGSAALMAQSGSQVDAIDPVPEMIALAKAQPGVQARLGGFEDIEGTRLYDGIWANFSLLHAPRDIMPNHLTRISKALKEGGRFHIAVKTGTGAHRDSIGRLYTYYTETELTGLLADTGLSVMDRREGVSPGLSGEEAHWIALAATRD